MKVNEAPEKLYFFNNEPILKERSVKRQDANIEYTRTEAFIDKACEYLHRCLEDTKVIDDYRNILVSGVQASYTSVEEFIEDFKSYIRGE